MTRKIFLILTFCISILLASAQKPKNGTYTYTIAFEEWGGKSLGATCTVKIKGDFIQIINNGKGCLTGKKGDIIEQGTIMKHKTGKWIIAHSPKDIYASEVGGCSSGPTIIDFKNKKFWLC